MTAFLVDFGANIFLVNVLNLLRNVRPCNIPLKQSGGSKSTLTHIGTLDLLLGGKIYTIPGVFYSPSAPVNILGGGYLRRTLGFRDCTHSIYKYFSMTDKAGNTVKIIGKKNKDQQEYLHIINGLDYATVPVLSGSPKTDVIAAANASIIQGKLPHSHSSSSSSAHTDPDPSTNTKNPGFSSTSQKHPSPLESAMKQTMHRMRERLYDKAKELFPAIASELDVDNIVGQLHTTHASFLRRFMSGWNESEDIPFVDFIQYMKNLQRQIDYLECNGKFAQHRFLSHSSSPSQDDETPSTPSQTASSSSAGRYCQPIGEPPDDPIANAGIVTVLKQFSPYHLHCSCGHVADDAVIQTINSGCFTDVPQDWKPARLPFPCPICAITKNPIPSVGPSVDYSSHAPGQCLFMDFGFMDVTSVRGFTAILLVVCAVTGYEFSFNTRHKRAPIELIDHLLTHMEKLGKKCTTIRTDNGGELARSTEFNKMCWDKHSVTVLDNGGYYPKSMGKVETRWTGRKASIRSNIMHAPKELDDTYWCYASDSVTWIRRRLCRKSAKKSPIMLWSSDSERPSIKHFHPWGCVMFVSNKKAAKLPALQDRSHFGYFLGYGATTHVAEYKFPGQHKVGRCNKPSFDDFGTMLETTTPMRALLRSLKDTIPQVLPSKAMTELPGPFVQSDLFTYSVTIPRTGPLRITVTNDPIFGIPTITKVFKTSPFFKGLPAKYRKNTFIVRIHNDEPITMGRLHEYVEYLRTNNILTFDVTVSKRPQCDTSEFQELRQYCNQLRPCVASAIIDSPTTHEPPYIPDPDPIFIPTTYANAFMAFTPPGLTSLPPPSGPPSLTPEVNVNIRVFEDIPVPKFNHIGNNPYASYWKMARHNRYRKNCRIPIWSGPLDRELVPPGAKIYEPVIAWSVKDTAEDNVKELYCRVCVNGGPQEKYVDYHPEPTPTTGHETLRMCVAIAAIMQLKSAWGDASNAFQCTPRPPFQGPVYMSSPPDYKEWFEQEFPSIKIPKAKRYVVEILGYLNGFKDASYEWYKLLKKYFEKADISPSQIDAAVFFRKRIVNGAVQYILICTLTDDLGVFYSHDSILDEIKTILNKGLTVKWQKGPVYKFGNFRIIETEHGYSIDQTAHTQKLLDGYFGPEDKVPKTFTPLRTDRDFETQINLALPATPAQLKELESQFGGSYLKIFGQILNIMTGTRPDIANALNRLGIFQSAPTELGFWSLRRVLQYLYTVSNCPLFYPKGQAGKESIYHTQVFKNGEEDKLIVPHCLCGHADISFAPYRVRRHSIEATIETMLGVLVGWRVSGQTSCAGSTAEAELIANYRETKRIIAKRNFLFDICIPQGLPTPIFSDNKAVRDFIEGGSMTRNLKHIEIPTCVIADSKLKGKVETRTCTHHSALADPFTKSCSGNELQKARRFLFGVRYFPPVDSDHYYYLIHPYHDDPSRKDIIIPLSDA